MSWEFVVCIPGVTMAESIDSGDLCLVGPTDARYREVQAAPRIAQLLDAFRTPFGQMVSPTAVLRRRGAPTISAAELAFFRNIAAVASVIESKRQTVAYGRLTGAPFTDMFDVYPVTVGRGDQCLLLNTAAESGLDFTSTFQGQPSPIVLHPDHFTPTLDRPLLKALLALRESRSRRVTVRLFRERVGRSLEMAHQALRSSYTQLGGPSDYGHKLSMWVSAFEILANPWASDVRFSDVAKLIRSVPWRHRELTLARFRPIPTRKQRSSHMPASKLANTTLPVQIYGRLYRARNIVLHGSKLPTGGLEPGRHASWGPLEFQAAALYRGVLLHCLASSGFYSFPVLRGDWSNAREVWVHKDAEKTLLVRGRTGSGP